MIPTALTLQSRTKLDFSTITEKLTSFQMYANLTMFLMQKARLKTMLPSSKIWKETKTTLNYLTKSQSSFSRIDQLITTMMLILTEANKEVRELHLDDGHLIARNIMRKLRNFTKQLLLVTIYRALSSRISIAARTLVQLQDRDSLLNNWPSQVKLVIKEAQSLATSVIKCPLQ